MQRSLLPAGPPEIDGLDVGAVYESSAQSMSAATSTTS